MKLVTVIFSIGLVFTGLAFANAPNRLTVDLTGTMGPSPADNSDQQTERLKAVMQVNHLTEGEASLVLYAEAAENAGLDQFLAKWTRDWAQALGETVSPDMTEISQLMDQSGPLSETQAELVYLSRKTMEALAAQSEKAQPAINLVEQREAELTDLLRRSSSNKAN